MEMASTVSNTNIDQRPNINIDNFDVTLVEFQQNITNYATYRNTTIPPDIAKDMESIRAWIDEQKMSSGNARTSKDISNVGNVLATSISSIQAICSGQLGEVMKGCLNIVGTIATVVEGPHGAVASALCGVLGKILSLSSPNEPDLATMFINNVHLELQKFDERLQRQKFHGLAARVKIMNSYLKILLSATEDVQLPDRVLFETDFPQFIGEVSESFVSGLSAESTEKVINDCLRSMVVYCNLQTLLLLLLANVLATFQVIGRQTMLIQNLLNEQKADAIQKLGFLSNFMVFQLRRNHPFYEVVEKFRESLGMNTMPETDDTTENEAFRGVTLSFNSKPKSISHLYPQPQMRGDNHYFQLINHTDVPIKVVCDGIAGDNVNGLKFRRDVHPRSSYEHIATESTWNFSTGGFFVIYLDGRMRSFGNMFENRRNLKVFEFALSNPVIGFRKSALLEKTGNLLSVTGQDCWKQMHSISSPPIFFVHNNKHFFVSGSKTDDDFSSKGKNMCCTWRFVVQEYDPQETTCSIL